MQKGAQDLRICFMISCHIFGSHGSAGITSWDRHCLRPRSTARPQSQGPIEIGPWNCWLQSPEAKMSGCNSKILLFSSLFGEIIKFEIWLIFFSDGLVQPLSRTNCYLFLCFWWKVQLKWCFFGLSGSASSHFVIFCVKPPRCLAYCRAAEW